MKTLISAQETARRLSIDVSTLTRWRQARRGPPCFRLGKAWKYDEREVNAYIESCRRASDEFQEILNRPIVGPVETAL